MVTVKKKYMHGHCKKRTICVYVFIELNYKCNNYVCIYCNPIRFSMFFVFLFGFEE